MKKLDREELDPIGKWILESGLESPSQDLQMKIMQRLSVKPAKREYQPVISPRGFRWIGFGLLSFFIAVLIFVPPTYSNQNFWNQISAIYSIDAHYLQIPKEYINPSNFGMVSNLSISFFFLLAFGLVLLKSINWKFEQ